MAKAYSYQRFSSGRQSKGSSLERQFEKAKAYAADHGLDLDTSLKPDAGLSGYSGKHRTKGSLGDFLAMVKAGEIARGSYLLVEVMDRLSREGLAQAAYQLLGLALAGIKVVTINDGMVFDDQADLPTMLHAVLKMDAANQYSVTLGDRVAKGHARRKTQAREEGRIYSKSGPEWLCVNAARTGWERRPERVALVRRIFNMADEHGMGSRVIAHHLSGEPTFKHGAKWHQVTVLKILRNRAVLGEYQPRFRDGSPDGEPVVGYYRTPESEGIIEPDQFARVNARLDGSKKFGRRTGPNEVRDLLQGLGKCGTCGGTAGVHKRSKDGRMLWHCNEAGGKGCTNTVRFRRDEIEATMLRVIAELDLCPRQDRPANDAALEVALAQRADLAAKVERLLDMLEDGDATMRERYRARVGELAAKDAEIVKLRTVAEQTGARLGPTKHQDVLRDFTAKLPTLTGADLYAARSRLSAALKSIVDFVTFEPEGYVELILLGGVKAYRIGRSGEAMGEVQLLPSLATGKKTFTAEGQMTRADAKRVATYGRIMAA